MLLILIQIVNLSAKFNVINFEIYAMEGNVNGEK